MRPLQIVALCLALLLAPSCIGGMIAGVQLYAAQTGIDQLVTVGR